MDDLDHARAFRAGVAYPSEEVAAAARQALLRSLRDGRAARSSRRARVALGVAVAAALVLASGLALAAGGILDGPAAPPENQRALTGLFPPLRIGPATTLASHDGRTLFGARTEAGGYCFSATSPIDPGAQGGHCVSEAEARALDAREAVAFAMSGGSAGGYAPGAREVRVTGPGVDVTIPVGANGWWVGEVRLPQPPLPPGVRSGTVVAAAVAEDGRVLGRDALLWVERRGEAGAHVYLIAFV